jgi:hypothetical protein
MISKSKSKSLIEHSLTSNVPFAQKMDTEDEGLSQILTILNSMPVDEHQAYIKQVVGRLASTKKSKIPRILADTQAYTTAMHFNKIPEMRPNTSAGGGMSVRHLISWSPATGGVSLTMISSARHFTLTPDGPSAAPGIHIRLRLPSPTVPGLSHPSPAGAEHRKSGRRSSAPRHR